MATQITPSPETPRMASKYRHLCKSKSSPRPADIFCGGDRLWSSPTRKLRSGSLHALRGTNRDSQTSPKPSSLPSSAPASEPLKLQSPSPSPDKGNDKTKSESEQTLTNKPRPAQNESQNEPLVDGPQQVKEKVESEMPRHAPCPPPAPAETQQQTMAEPKRQHLARLQAALSVTPPPKSRSPLLSLFSRTKKTLTPKIVQPDTPSSVATTVFTSRAHSIETVSNPDSVRSSELVEKPLVSVAATTPSARPSLQFERRVAVRCLSSTINLPVSFETTATDILLLASTMMRHALDPATCVVVESYLMLGLERRLRRYERILDVMNSWDKDHDNSLLILTCPASVNDGDLDIETVPSIDDKPPTGFTLQLYQSSRPGKWNRRWITLLENGNLFATKTAEAFAGDLSSTHLCHLADSDIYTPKQSEIRQSVKPPKQFCYAVKSQRKSILFPDEKNFVHFFSTDDEKTATRFYELVHAWRSWHLVTRKTLLDRRLNARAPQLTFDSNNALDMSSSSSSGGQESKSESASSSAASPLGIGGAFQSLFDMDNIAKLAEEAIKRQSILPPVAEATTPDDEKQSPPAAIPTSTSTSSKRDEQGVKSSLNGAESNRSSGSLGTENTGSIDSPSTRRSSMDLAGSDGSPPTEKKKPEPRSWFPSAAEHSAKVRKEAPAKPIRRPPPIPAMAARPVIGGNQRRVNNLPLLSIDTQLLETARMGEGNKLLGEPACRSSKANGAPLMYKLPPGTTSKMTSAPNKARAMIRAGSSMAQAGAQPRNNRQTVGVVQSGRRYMAEGASSVPPVPSLMASRKDVVGVPPVPSIVAARKDGSVSPPSKPSASTLMQSQSQAQSRPRPRPSPPQRSPSRPCAPSPMSMT